jgi:hypothetical protein
MPQPARGLYRTPQCALHLVIASRSDRLVFMVVVIVSEVSRVLSGQNYNFMSVVLDRKMVTNNNCYIGVIPRTDVSLNLLLWNKINVHENAFQSGARKKNAH